MFSIKYKDQKGNEFDLYDIGFSNKRFKGKRL